MASGSDLYGEISIALRCRQLRRACVGNARFVQSAVGRKRRGQCVYRARVTAIGGLDHCGRQVQRQRRVGR